jgi:Mg2+-importing ATPase
MRQIARFILLVGPCSSVFDLLTFAVMWHGFGWSGPEERALFRTGWFVESLVTQTLAIHVIRTPRIPLLRSRASPALTATTLVVVAAGGETDYDALRPDTWKQSHPEAIRLYRQEERRARADAKAVKRARRRIASRG